MKLDFERAIVVSIGEVETLLNAICTERHRIQELPKSGTPVINRMRAEDLRNLAVVEDRLLEVLEHQKTDETIWEEHMREYEEAER